MLATITDKDGGASMVSANFSRTGESLVIVTDAVLSNELICQRRDSIMKTNRLTSNNFRDDLTITREPGLIEICSFDGPRVDDEPKLLGFIRFKYDQQTLEGVLTISNFNARLQRWHLLFGGTAKNKDDAQTGQHGEGLKMAIVQFRRHPHCHSVQIEASSFSWVFNFKKNKQMACTLTRIDPRRIESEQLQAGENPRTAQSRCWSDVTVIIGKPRTVTGENGVQEMGQRIRLEDFERFQDICLDIKNPKSIRTRRGDLIIEEAEANNIYLRGFRLEHSNATEKRYRFGYNFNSGYTDRERRAVGRSGEPWDESKLVNDIWQGVLRTRAEEYIGVYTDMVLNSLEDLADVTLVIDGKYLPRDIVGMIWRHMQTINANEDGKSAFYHAPDISNSVSSGSSYKDDF
jgi:hypothetical protein